MSKITSGACLALVTSLSVAPALAQGTSLQRAACTSDVFRLCSADIPNVDRITACLHREKPKLSAGCQQVFSSLPPVKVATRSLGPAEDTTSVWCAFGDTPAPGQEVWIAWCSQKSRAP